MRRVECYDPAVDSDTLLTFGVVLVCKGGTYDDTPGIHPPKYIPGDRRQMANIFAMRLQVSVQGFLSEFDRK